MFIAIIRSYSFSLLGVDSRVREQDVVSVHHYGQDRKSVLHPLIDCASVLELS